jgi:uncharacterized protein YcfJ
LRIESREFPAQFDERRLAMKLEITLAAAVAAVLAAQPAAADRYGSSHYGPARVSDAAYRDHGSEPGIAYARVVDVQPIVRHVTVSTPRQECWDETVYREPSKGIGAMIAGGIIGGAVGHQFGSGRGQDAMTVIGSVVGSTVANNVARKRNGDGYPETIQRCETHSELREEERIEGYDVTYEYDGQKYRTRTREHPGDEIAVRVVVTPVGY